MASTLKNLVLKGCSCMSSTPLSKSFSEKLLCIGDNYATIEAFKNASIAELNSFKTVEGLPCFNPLTSKEIEIITALQEKLQIDISIEENFIKILTFNFIQKQLNMLNTMTIEGLNANPILCHALKLDNENDFIKYYAYSAISRSIVTSLGFLVQDLLLYSNEFIFSGKDYSAGQKTKWDIVLDKLDEVKTYFEIKSGPNDMDAAQIKHYDEEIKLVEQNGEKAFIGITYGKKDVRTVTTGLLETYVDDWKDKVLIGSELWDYISGNDNYHNILLNQIKSVAESCLNSGSIVPKIDEKIEELIVKFNEKYSTIEEYYNTLW